MKPSRVILVILLFGISGLVQGCHDLPLNVVHAIQQHFMGDNRTDSVSIIGIRTPLPQQPILSTEMPVQPGKEQGGSEQHIATLPNNESKNESQKIQDNQQNNSNTTPRFTRKISIRKKTVEPMRIIEPDQEDNQQGQDNVSGEPSSGVPAASATVGYTEPEPPSPSSSSSYSSGDEWPTITTRVSPSNPDVGEVFEITINAEDDKGIRYLGWASSKPLREGSAGSSPCNLQKTCSRTWRLTPITDGLHRLTLSVEDTSGRDPRIIPTEITVYPARTTSTTSSTPTNTTSSTSSTSTGSSSTGGGLVAIRPSERTANTSGNTGTPTSANTCTYNSDCGTRQRCRSGSCVDVQCTTSSQCGTCQRCSDYQCRSCGYGPYGCYC